MTRYGSIYVVTNTVTGEQYVGQTRQKAVRRWKCHINTAHSNTAPKYRLAHAILEYGKAAFEFAEVFSAFDAKMLDTVEVNLIAELSPTYNITKGGAGHRGVVASEKVRLARSERLKKQWSDPEWRAAQLEKLQQMAKSPEAVERGRRVAALGIAARWANHVKKVPVPRTRAMATRASWEDCAVREKRMAGIAASNMLPEVKARRTAASTGRVPTPEAIYKSARSKWKPVYCPELACSFLSQKAASEFLGVLHTSVTNAVKQKGRVAGKYTLEKVA